jgi:hypothetical protein
MIALWCRNGGTWKATQDVTIVSAAVMFHNDGVTVDEVAEYIRKTAFKLSVNGKKQMQGPIMHLPCLGATPSIPPRQLRVPIAVAKGEEVHAELEAVAPLQHGAALDRPTIVLEVAGDLGCDIVWVPPLRYEAVPQQDRCECGAFKASGISKGAVGHSDWCPWRKP